LSGAYKDSTATTEQFFAVANEHLKNTPLAQKYGYKDLNWFYRQWATQTCLPSYELSYHIEGDTAGGVILKGELLQKGIPEGETWFMPLPLLLHFHGGKVSRGTLAVLGTHTPISIKLPQLPEKSNWIQNYGFSLTRPRPRNNSCSCAGQPGARSTCVRCRRRSRSRPTSFPALHPLRRWWCVPVARCRIVPDTLRSCRRSL
jgi:hypothetical protein